MKIFRVLFLALLLLLSAAFCYADDYSMENYYPKYLNGDRNWVLVDARMDAGQYLNIRSVHVDKYHPPYYTISGEYVIASFNRNNDGSLNWQPYRIDKKWTTIDYNYRNRRLSIDNGQVVIDDPSGPGYLTNFTVGLSQSMFWVAYKMPFFRPEYDRNFLPSFDSRFR